MDDATASTDTPPAGNANTALPPPKTWIHAVARWAIKPLVDTAVTPNQLTTVRLITGILAAVALAVGTHEWFFYGGWIFILSAFFDRADGELARLSKRTSPGGHQFDLFCDLLAATLAFVGIGFGLRNEPAGFWSIGMGFVAGTSIAVIFWVIELIRAAKDDGKHVFPTRGGFDPDDGLFLLGPIAWFGASTLWPLLIAASIGAPLFALWTAWRDRHVLFHRPLKTGPSVPKPVATQSPTFKQLEYSRPCDKARSSSYPAMTILSSLSKATLVPTPLPVNALPEVPTPESKIPSPLSRTTGKLTKTWVFDAYGTLFDVHSAVAQHRDRLGRKAEPFSTLWRTRQLEYTWLRSLMGCHADFWQVTQEALDYACTRFGVTDNKLRNDLVEAYRHLDCYPEVPIALRHLKARGCRTGILSNASPAMLADAVKSAGLEGLIDVVLSAESAGVYKPDPRVYRLAVDAFQVEPQQISFQTANAWDAAGAARCGFRVIWINPVGCPAEHLPYEATCQIKSLAELSALA